MCRRLKFRPKAHYFKPQGIPMHQLEEVVLTKEEMEVERRALEENKAKKNTITESIKRDLNE